jgi:Bacterial Alpha-2-macroglobulin MG10 domain
MSSRKSIRFILLPPILLLICADNISPRTEISSSGASGMGSKYSLIAFTPAPGGGRIFTENANYTGRRRLVYQELRDRKVALFIDKLPEGVWEIRYQLRAEAPVIGHALPVIGHAMYAPEIRANGVETRLIVDEGK